MFFLSLKNSIYIRIIFPRKIISYIFRFMPELARIRKELQIALV